MRGDVSSPVRGRFDRGAQLGFGEGDDLQRTERRGDAATGRQLDLRRSLHELFARALAHFIRTVGDGSCSQLLDPAQRPARGPGQVTDLTKVSMAAADGDDSA